MRNVFMSMLLALGLSNAAFAKENNTITVSGFAEKTMKPDMAVVYVSVWGKGASAKKAQEINQKYFETFKKGIAKFNIKEEDVKTSQYSLNPEYDYNEKTKKNDLTGYHARQGLKVTIKNVADIGGFIDSLADDKNVKDGGINLNSLSFDLIKRKEEEQKLLTDAFKSAQEKAEILARAAKVKIKGVQSIQPMGVPYRPQRMMRSDMMMAKSVNSGTEIMSGEIELQSELTADFIID